jgi:hypothetical protein
VQVIAEQLGHADTRITQKYHAHLSQSYVADVIRAVADVIRAVFPAPGIVN